MVTLQYVDSMNVFFRDNTYRWLDAAHFAISGPAPEPLTLLKALLGHEQYLDHYMTADDVACTPNSAAEIARRRADLEARVIEQAPHIVRAVPEDLPSGSPRPMHGPYYAEFVTPQRFDRLDAAAALESVTAWFRAAGGGDPPVPPIEQLDGDLAAVIGTFDAFAEAYRLQQMPDTAMHDYGFVVQPYLELIGVDAHRSNLWLVAGGTD